MLDRHSLLTLAAALLEAGDRARRDSSPFGEAIIGGPRLPQPYEYVGRAADLFAAAREASDFQPVTPGVHTAPVPDPDDPSRVAPPPAPAAPPALSDDERAAYEARIRELEAERTVLAVLARSDAQYHAIAFRSAADAAVARFVRDRLIATLRGQYAVLDRAVALLGTRMPHHVGR